MNQFILATFLCMGALISGNPVFDDSQWRGEGFYHSLDWTNQYPIQYQQPLPYSTPYPLIISDSLRAISYIGPDGNVVIPAETVKRAKTRMRQLAMSSGAWNPNVAWVPMASRGQGTANAPLASDEKVLDTPEVATANTEHFAAKAIANAAPSNGTINKNLNNVSLKSVLPTIK